MKSTASTTPKRRKATKMALALLLAFGLTPWAMAACPRTAYADTGTLTVGDRIDYAGFFTNHFDVDGHWAYCVNPSKPAPKSGTYEVVSFWDYSATHWEYFAGLLYYSYGAPGWDPAMWPDAYYDGSPWTHEKRLVINHILWTNAYENTATPALVGTSKEFRDWYDYHMNSWFGNPNAANSYMHLARERFASEFDEQYRKQFADSVRLLLGPDGTQNIGYLGPFDPTGAIELQKESANESLTEGNASYRLAGAEYGVFADEACTKQLRTLVTDENGYARSDDDLPPGDVWLKETKAPAGYALDKTVHRTTVAAGETVRISLQDPPQHNPLELVVEKKDADLNGDAAQGDGTLAGARFTVRHYGGSFATAAAAEASGPPLRTWTFATDAAGRARLTDPDSLISGDALYRDASGTVTFPLGTYLLQETAPPAGYLANRQVFVRHVLAGGTGETVRTYAAPTVPEPGMRGGVELEKLDAETNDNKPLGGASLDASFEIVNESSGAVRIGGTNFEPGEVVYRGRAERQDDGGYVFSTDSDGDGIDRTLPYGTYSIRETAAGAGYENPSPEKSARFEIRKDGEVVRIPSSDTFSNQVMRGDVRFAKKSGVSSAKLAGIPFRLTSETTGESHVIVTDGNGTASTAAERNAHTERTNANDKAVRADGSVDESLLDPSAGVWFGVDAAPDDERGALPYDTYRIEELRVQANEGLALVEDVLIIGEGESGRVLDFGTIDDNGDTPPSVRSNAFDGSSGDFHDGVIEAEGQARIIDQLRYDHFPQGAECTATATLAYAETGEPVLQDGKPVTGETTWKTDRASGTVQVELTFDASQFEDGCRLVVLQSIAKGGAEFVAHDDPGDAAQIIQVHRPPMEEPPAPAIDTALSTAQNEKTATKSSRMELTDAVEYRNLPCDGETYELHGQLMRRTTETSADGTESTHVEPFVDAGGNKVVSHVEFTPEDTHGAVEATFAFNGLNLEEDDQLIAFQTLVKDDEGLAAHDDPDDTNQTVAVSLPRLTTKAADGRDGDKAVTADDKAVVIDTVSYENLTPGTTYRLTGTLMRKDTQEPLLAEKSASDSSKTDAEAGTGGEPGDGSVEASPVTTSVEFVPQHGSGVSELEYRFDATAFIGAQDPVELVSFVSLEEAGAEVAAHRDLQSEDQGISVVAPRIATHATTEDGGQAIDLATDSLIVDEIRYENLLPGISYTLQGTLVDQETGLPLEDESGLPLSASKTFVPNEPDGTMLIEFPVDAAQLQGKTAVVAFERLFKDGREDPVATHENLHDQGQTVWVGAPPSPPDQPRGPLGQTGDFKARAATAFAVAAVLALATLALAKTRQPARSNRP